MSKRIVASVSTSLFFAVALLTGCTFEGAGVAGVADTIVVASAAQVEPVTATKDIVEQSTEGVSTPVFAYKLLENRWGIERISVAQAWRSVDTFHPVLVAILDTGISPDAPFARRIVGSIDLTSEGTVDDTHGHGTHMTGTIAAVAPNASFLNVKVADARGRCDTATVAKGIRWAADRGAQVINVSLEVAPSQELENAVRYAWERGAIVVAAAGNSGTSAPAYPAAYPVALAVAGTSQSDGLAVLSNHGDWVDIAAPGFKIYAERLGADYGYETGTSPAAAHVSGVAALVFGVATDTSGNGLLNDEVRTILEATAQRLTVAGTGNGLVNALEAVLLAISK